MSSPNILLTRIDNRLVHGQVGVTWTSTIGANLLVVGVLPRKPTALAFVSLLSKKPLTSSAKLHRIRRSS